jgi:hypothetical protein
MGDGVLNATAPKRVAAATKTARDDKKVRERAFTTESLIPAARKVRAVRRICFD